MGEALEWIGGMMAIAGSLFCVIGGIGMLRLPDFFSRTHAASIGDSLGAALVLLGLVVYESAQWFQTQESGGSVSVIIKLLLLLGFIYVVSPTATHALAKAAFAGGVRVDSVAAPGSASDEAQSNLDGQEGSPR